MLLNLPLRNGNFVLCVESVHAAHPLESSFKEWKLRPPSRVARLPRTLESSFKEWKLEIPHPAVRIQWPLESSFKEWKQHFKPPTLLRQPPLESSFKEWKLSWICICHSTPSPLLNLPLRNGNRSAVFLCRGPRELLNLPLRNGNQGTQK